MAEKGGMVRPLSTQPCSSKYSRFRADGRLPEFGAGPKLRRRLHFARDLDKPFTGPLFCLIAGLKFVLELFLANFDEDRTGRGAGFESESDEVIALDERRNDFG